MEYDYGDLSRGHSFEYYNFFHSLRSLGHEVILFDYMAEFKRIGKQAMNEQLLTLVIKEKPDLAMFSLYTDQIEPATAIALRKYTKTLCFFHDDTWRVEFSRFWAQHFDYFTTPDVYGELKYKALGLSNAIYFPFGCNDDLYLKNDHSEYRYDVTFVGAWHPYREWMIKRLQKFGIQVRIWGHRWPSGTLAHPDMVNIFNESRINLNLSNSTNWDARYLLKSPRGLLNLIRSSKSVEQLKARHFEINGCGGFQLSYYVEGLERQYAIGSEIAIFIDPDDLVHKVKYYLSNERERVEIANAGRVRTLQEHTYKKRFSQVFRRMGIKID
jgi:spore maturation protein CgeB